jgi:hypothetical protein
MTDWLNTGQTKQHADLLNYGTALSAVFVQLSDKNRPTQLLIEQITV